GASTRCWAAGLRDESGFGEQCARPSRVRGAELRDTPSPQPRPAYLQRLRRAAADLGLALIGIGVHNDFGHADSTWRQSEIVKVKQWVEVAGEIGAGHVRVFAGHPQGPVAERWPAMIDGLREVAAYAAESGVRLALENEAGFTPSAAEHLRIVEEVGS